MKYKLTTSNETQPEVETKHESKIHSQQAIGK